MATLKNEKIAMLLAGIVCFLGMGHFYAGKIWRGLVLLFGGWALIFGSFLCFAAWSMSGLVIPPSGYTPVEPPAWGPYFLLGGIVLFLGFIALWIWQIFNARRVCQDRNKQAVD